DAPLEAWQNLGLAVPGQGAARPGYTPSGTQRAHEHNSTVHAAQGTAGAALPDMHRAAEPTCSSLQLQKPCSLWWQATMPLGRSASLLGAGRAQGSPATSGATSALDVGE